MHLHVACCLWEPNKHSHHFSKRYNEQWVNKLYRGFARNLTIPFRFVCFTDRERVFTHDEIDQIPLKARTPDYGSMIEPFALGWPTILVGLDTVILGNIDHLARYCLDEHKIALPRDPNDLRVACNGVALVPWSQQRVFEDWNGENDMLWLRKQPHVFIDDLFPGEVVSYKCNVKKSGLGNAKIVYFHGDEKPGEIKEDFLERHWN